MENSKVLEVLSPSLMKIFTQSTPPSSPLSPQLLMKIFRYIGYVSLLGDFKTKTPSFYKLMKIDMQDALL
jgi:hypothetical protein